MTRPCRRRRERGAALPFYLGDEVVDSRRELSPDARWLLVVTEPKSIAKGREGQLTRYVTESGYEEFEKERCASAQSARAAILAAAHLTDHTMHPLALENSPGFTTIRSMPYARRTPRRTRGHSATARGPAEEKVAWRQEGARRLGDQR